MYCLGCRYCLDGLTEFRCPECGRGFHPQLTGSFESGAPNDRKALIAGFMLFSATVGILAFLLVLGGASGANALFGISIGAELLVVVVGVVYGAFLQLESSGVRRAAITVALMQLGIWLLVMGLSRVTTGLPPVISP